MGFGRWALAQCGTGLLRRFSLVPNPGRGCAIGMFFTVW